ncbi:MAG: hypothetical protein PHY30_02210 [Candidatus Pacebacteria bacterium]|nr:hypothetical protein [Candidatus Paceibacterota bacterium]
MPALYLAMKGISRFNLSVIVGEVSKESIYENCTYANLDWLVLYAKKERLMDGM